MDELIYEEEIFKESEIAPLHHSSENPISSWIDEVLYDMIRNHDNGEHTGFYKISIVRFNSEEELKDYQEGFL